MKSPDPYAALYLTGPQWHRTLGDRLRSDLIYFWGKPHQRHPFAERMLHAVFDDCGIPRDDRYRYLIFRHLCLQLSVRSMKTIAKKGFDLICMDTNPGSGRVAPSFDSVEWARSSERCKNVCLGVGISALEQQSAEAAAQVEVKQIAAIMADVMDSIYQDVERFHDAHRPHWHGGETVNSTSVE